MPSLDFPIDDFERLLHKSTEMVIRQLQQVDQQQAFHSLPQPEVESWFDEKMPEDGMDTTALLDWVEQYVFKYATGNLGPNMYAYVTSGGNQIGILAETLAATINQNVAKWHLAPTIVEMEKRVIQWASEMIHYRESVGGFLVSSGSAANFDGLTIARNVFFEKHDLKNKGLFGMKPFVVYCSTETHSCIDKSIQMLGIGLNQLRKIPVNPDYTINLPALEEQIQLDLNAGYQPFCIVGNAGTVNTGAIDDLTALAQIAWTKTQKEKPENASSKSKLATPERRKKKHQFIFPSCGAWMDACLEK